MDIIQTFLTRNDCYNAGVHFVPQGIMVHSTATPGATAQDFLSAWNKSFRLGEMDDQCCVHFFVDDTGVYQTLPLEFRAWHAGKLANDMFLSFEICEPADLNDAEYFKKVWENARNLCVSLTKKYNFDTDMIICHCEGYQKGWATNHADVMHWFPLHNKDMDMFRDEVWGAIHNPQPEVINVAQLNFDESLQLLRERGIINTPNSNELDRWKTAGELVVFFKDFVTKIGNYIATHCPK